MFHYEYRFCYDITVLAKISRRIARSIPPHRSGIVTWSRIITWSGIVTWGSIVTGRRIVVVRIRVVTVDRGSIGEPRIIVIVRWPKCSIPELIGITIVVTVLVPVWILVTITTAPHSNTDASILSIGRCREPETNDEAYCEFCELV